jgi:hypothetical protein
MDGFEASRKISEIIEKEHKKTIIVIITAYD